jgi:hypothetical protein
LTPTAATTITGLVAGYDGQIVIITNLSSYLLTIKALNSGSLSANQFRIVGDFALQQYNGISFKYSATIGNWIFI